MNLAAPDLLWLALTAPAAVVATLWLLARRSAAENAWAARSMQPRLRRGAAPRSRAMLAALLGLAALGAALALARPRWGESVEQVQQRGVDIVFVLDTSASMATYDVLPSRLWLAQSLIRRMAEELPGNRVALLQAEGVGVVMAPLTVDAAVLDLLLDAVEPGTLPVPGTRLAPALERAVELFPAGNEKHRVLVLLSDGEDHGDDLDRATETLRRAGVVVHTIGVGTEHGGPIPQPGESGAFKRDERGEVVLSRLHRDVLEQLAARTDGLFLAAADTRADPAPLIARIRQMQKRELTQASVATLEERYQWPLAFAVGALLLWLALSPYRAPYGGRA